jgi:hypothetical protein
MGYQFDGVNKKVILTPGTISVDVDDMYSRWYDWMVSSDNAKFPLAFRTVGGDSISNVKNLGITFFIMNGWRIVPQSSNHRLTINGNLFTDPFGDSPVNTIEGYSIIVEYSVSNLVDSTLAQMSEIEYSSFGGGVTVDMASSYSGTDYPVGTPRQPVNNMIDGLIIAKERGFTSFFILGDILLDASQDFSLMSFYGDSKDKTTITVADDANVYRCDFYSATLTGILDGQCKIRDCVVSNVNYISGFIEECVLQGTIQLGGGASAYFLDCYAGSNYGEPPTIDLGGSGQTLVMQNFNGYIKWKNKTGIEQANASLNAGWVIVEDTVSDGEVNIIGVGVVEDFSTGSAIVNTQNLMSKQTITEIILDTIHIDTNNGVSGTAFPIGTPGTPCSNFDDALTIAEKYGIKKFAVVGEITISQDLQQYTFTGISPETSIVNLTGSSLTGVMFNNCFIAGTQYTYHSGAFDRTKAYFEYHDCYLSSVIDLDGKAVDCQIGGTNKIRSGGFFSAMEIVVEGDETFFDLQNSNAVVSMDMNSGWAQFVNAGSGSLIELNVKGGEVSLYDSCTGGEYYLEGIGTLYNESAMIEKENHFPLDEPMEYHNIEGSLADTIRRIPEQTAELSGVRIIDGTITSDEALRIILNDVIKTRKMTTNRAVISSDKRLVTIYDDDGESILHQFDVSSDLLERTPK